MKNKYKILVVDDELLNHLLIKIILEKNENYILMEAYDGIEAINLVEQNEFDIILMDIRMPEIDGIQATKIIKKTYPNIPIVCISAYTSNTIDTKIFDDIVNKPIISKVLINTIKKYLN